MRLDENEIKKLLEEFKEEVSKSNSIQASEKLYKVAEECVKNLAIKYQVEIRVKKGQYMTANLIDHWSSSMLFQAVKKLKKILGKDLDDGWKSAWEIHVWGFHENELTIDDILDEMNSVRKLLAFCIDVNRMF